MALKERLKKISDNSKQFDIIRLNELKNELNELVLEKINSFSSWKNFDKNQQENLVSKFIDAKINERNLDLQDEDIIKIKQWIFDDVFKLSLLNNFFINENCKKIMFNGFSNFFINEKPAKTIFNNEKHFLNVIYQILVSNGQINSTDNIEKYYFKFYVNNEYILTIILPPKSSKPVLCIEKFSDKDYTFNELIKEGIIFKKDADTLINTIQKKEKIIIKTSSYEILNAVLNEIDTPTALFQEILTSNIQKEFLIKLEKPIINILNLGVQFIVIENCTQAELDLISSFNLPFVAITELNLKSDGIKIIDL